MKAGGKMENNTVKASTERMAVIEKASGRTAKESSGSPVTMLEAPTSE